jgi:polo-like kinase 1
MKLIETNDVKATYRRIKMNAYSFPVSQPLCNFQDHVPISEQAKDLIGKILHLEPTKRLSLTQILEHDFFHMGVAIPKALPAFTLACPPSEKYLMQFMPNLIGNPRDGA